MKNLLLSLLLATCYFGISQSHYCAATENLKEQIRLNPALISHLADIERQTQEKMLEGARASVLNIPVVFHVIHNGDPYGTGENLTDEQILSQLDALNRDFNNWNADTTTIPTVFRPLLGNMQVAFCLARFDESGAVFSGITRQDLGVAAWDRSGMETVGKPTTIWNPNAYFNIWIARFTGDLNGVLGYAQFPGMNPTTDGVVLRYDAVGTTGPRIAGNELGRVATHEVGHWMSLYHIWGDDGGDPNECAGSDSVGDTPNQRIENYGRPVHPVVSCGAQNLFMDYMDYVDDSSKVMFTIGQVNRARASLLSQRGQLLAASSNCNLNLDAEYVGMLSPSDTECMNNFIPIIKVRNNGKVNITSLEVIYNIDGGTNKNAYWIGDARPRQTFYFSLPKETVSGGSHTITIFLNNANHRGNDDYTSNDNGSYSFYTSGTGVIGQAIPMSEGFESSVLPTDWSIQNPNSDRTWVINTAAGGYGTSGQCMSIDNFDNSTNPTNRKDNIITASYNLVAANYPYLNFDVAYAPRSSTRNDTLSVYSSTDCGHSWNLLWKQGGAQLATQAELSVLFYPTNSQWKTNTIDLSSYIDVENIEFKFENKSGWGNVLYLDNINIKSHPVGVEDVFTEKNSIDLYPNPASSSIAINATNESIFPFHYAVLNYLGQELEQGTLLTNHQKINLNSIVTGSYLLRISNTENYNATFKISITK